MKHSWAAYYFRGFRLPDSYFGSYRVLLKNCPNGGHFDLHFFARWPPVWFTSFLNSDLSSAPWKTPKMTPHLTILHLISDCQNGGHFDLHFFPRWPPVWCTHLLNLDLSPEAWIPPKMTPHLTILHRTSKLSKWRSLWPPLFSIGDLQCGVHCFSTRI